MKQLLSIILVLWTDIYYDQTNTVQESQIKPLLEASGIGDIQRGTVVVLSDKIPTNEAQSAKELFHKNGNLLPGVMLILNGNAAYFEQHLPIATGKENVLVDDENIWLERLSGEVLMEVIHLHNGEIVKNYQSNATTLPEDQIALIAWIEAGIHKMVSQSLPNIRSLLPLGTKAPSLNRPEVSLEELVGKPVVLNFWSDRCGYCIVEMPILNRLFHEYKKEGVMFLSIYRDSEESLERYFSDERPYYGKDFVQFPVIPEAADIVEDYRVRAFPVTYVIDPKGNVTHRLGFTTRFDETVDLDGGVQSENPYFYQVLKGQIDRLLAGAS